MILYIYIYKHIYIFYYTTNNTSLLFLLESYFIVRKSNISRG